LVPLKLKCHGSDQHDGRVVSCRVVSSMLWSTDVPMVHSRDKKEGRLEQPL